MDNMEIWYSRIQVLILEPPLIFLNINKLKNTEPNPTNNNIFDIISISGNTSMHLLFFRWISYGNFRRYIFILLEGEEIDFVFPYLQYLIYGVILTAMYSEIEL